MELITINGNYTAIFSPLLAAAAPSLAAALIMRKTMLHSLKAVPKSIDKLFQGSRMIVIGVNSMNNQHCE